MCGKEWYRLVNGLFNKIWRTNKIPQYWRNSMLVQYWGCSRLLKLSENKAYVSYWEIFPIVAESKNIDYGNVNPILVILGRFTIEVIHFINNMMKCY